MKQPLFTDTVFRLYEAGDSYVQGNPTPCSESECPLTALPEGLDDQKMIQMYMSDFVPTSLSRAFRLAGEMKINLFGFIHILGLMSYNITPDMVPPTFPYKLTTKLIAVSVHVIIYL